MQGNTVLPGCIPIFTHANREILRRRVKEKDIRGIRLFNSIKKKGAKELITKCKRDPRSIMSIIFSMPRVDIIGNRLQPEGTLIWLIEVPPQEFSRTEEMPLF